MEAEAFIASGRIDEALETIENALADAPDNNQLLLVRARCELHSGNIDAAFENVSGVLESGDFFNSNPGRHRRFL